MAFDILQKRFIRRLEFVCRLGLQSPATIRSAVGLLCRAQTPLAEHIVCTYIQCGCSLPNKKLCVRLRGNRILILFIFTIFSSFCYFFFAFAMGIVFLLCCCLCCLMILSVTYHIFEMFSMCSFFYSWREELTYYFRKI